MKVLTFGLGFIATQVAEFLSSAHEVTVTYRSLNPVKKCTMVFYQVRE